MAEPGWRGIEIFLLKGRSDYIVCRLPGRRKKTGRVGAPEKRDEKDAQKRDEAIGRDPEPKRRAGPGLFRLFSITERWGKAGGELDKEEPRASGVASWIWGTLGMTTYRQSFFRAAQRTKITFSQAPRRQLG